MIGLSNKGGYSREGLFGDIIHYDSKGHKIGESRPGWFGSYTNYDADGHKIGRSEEQFLGLGYNHYDNAGHRIGSSDESFLGGYNNYDAGGHYTGHTDRSVFDIDGNTFRRTGSMYHKYYDPPRGSSYTYESGTTGNAKDRSNGNFSTGGAILIIFLGLVLTSLVYQAADEDISGGVLAVLWIAFSIGIAALINGIRNGFHRETTHTASAGQPQRDEWFDEEEEPSVGPNSNALPHVVAAATNTVRYIIARSCALGQDLYYRTNEEFHIGDLAMDTRTGELVKVLAAVECEEDSLPLEARTTRFVVRKTR